MFRNSFFIVTAIVIAMSIVLAVVRSPRVWYGQTKLVASEQVGGRRFGGVLTLNEETLLVGVPGYGESMNNAGGAVYVFERSTSAPGWVEQAKLRPADLQNNDQFGARVAVSGDTLAIAAPGIWLPHRPGFPNKRGMVFVFTRNGSTWSEQARLTSPNPITSQYGESIALEGDTLVVSEKNATQVFVHDRQMNTWSHHTTLTAPNPNWAFGSAVALSGDTIAVGGNGLVFVFERDRATGVWQGQAEVREPGAAGFGKAVALQGDTLVVGAYAESQLLQAETGAVYVFQRDPVMGFWSEQAKLRPRGARSGDGLLRFLNSYGFGVRVAIDRDAIAVVACQADFRLFYSGETAVYLFRRNPRTGRWLQQAKVMPPAQSQQKGFCTMALAGNMLLAGAPTEASEDGKRATGAVYLFDLQNPPP